MTVRSTWNGPQIKANVRAATTRALDAAAEVVLARAREVVPIEEATLARSGVASSEDQVAAVSFDTPYAVRQHEELTWRHAPGRQAKYLEQPLHETRSKQEAAIARIVGEALS